MTDHEETPTEAALREWGSAWQSASEKICLLTLLGLAEIANKHDVRTITLGWSDQGDWLTIDEVAGAGEGFDSDEAFDAIIDDSFAVGDLRNEWRHTWEPFVKADDHGESFILNVDDILAVLDVDEIGDKP